MGIAVAPPEQYENAIKKLFPPGEFWDRQFADPESDVSLFVKAKLEYLLRFRQRMGALHDESRIETASELLEAWERVLLNTINHGLDADQRKSILLAVGADSLNIKKIKKIGQLYGWVITGVHFPFRSAFFGFSHFGHDRITSPASFSVLYVHAGTDSKTAFALFSKNFRSACFGFARAGHGRIISPRAASAMSLYVRLSDPSLWEPLETNLKKSLLANYITFFFYGEATNAHVS